MSHTTAPQYACFVFCSFRNVPLRLPKGIASRLCVHTQCATSYCQYLVQYQWHCLLEALFSKLTNCTKMVILYLTIQPSSKTLTISLQIRNTPTNSKASGQIVYKCNRDKCGFAHSNTALLAEHIHRVHRNSQKCTKCGAWLTNEVADYSRLCNKCLKLWLHHGHYKSVTSQTLLDHQRFDMWLNTFFWVFVNKYGWHHKCDREYLLSCFIIMKR